MDLGLTFLPYNLLTLFRGISRNSFVGGERNPSPIPILRAPDASKIPKPKSTLEFCKSLLNDVKGGDKNIKPPPPP